MNLWNSHLSVTDVPKGRAFCVQLKRIFSNVALFMIAFPSRLNLKKPHAL